MAVVGAAQATAAVPVLVYHRFDPGQPASMSVRMATFRAQLAWLTQHHYRIVPLRTALADLADGKITSVSPEAVITADDGHKTVYTQLFPLIRAEGLPVTLFIYPSAISNASYAMTWDELREMQASGLVDVESHTYWHPNFKIEKRKRTAADYQAFVDNQLQRSKQVLESRMGRTVDMLAWPFGLVDADLEAAAKRAGYTTAFAYVGGPMKAGDERLALPRIPAADIAGDRFGDLLGVTK